MRDLLREGRLDRGLAGRTVLLTALAVMLVLLPSCGGSGDGGVLGPTGLQCAATAAGLNEVAMTCGGASGPTTEVIEVVLGGGAGAASDVQGVHFDVVYDAMKVEYVVDSATHGSLLNQDGDDPLLGAKLANGIQGRLIVGYDRTDQPAGVQASAAQTIVLRLKFRTVGTHAIAPVPLVFENEEVVDSTGAKINTITFQDGLSLEYL